MAHNKRRIVDSPLGKQEIDNSGPPVGVVRMDVDRAYAGTGELLQKVINDSDHVAWNQIRAKIDYMFENIDLILALLDQETGFNRQLKSRLEKGQKLLFKPNVVMPMNIDPQTHGPDQGCTTVTDWAFVAALMRWFHDKVGISYYNMCLGEAATGMSAAAGYYSMYHPDGKRVTTEAVLEGKSGNFYGGWGFYFVRKYLSESMKTNAEDDPMKGYQESEEGIYIPPGEVNDKLMVYDLNRIYDDPSKGREIDVPDGINYKTITLHKVIVGGNPNNDEDLKAYPGCILVNVPRLKVHCFTLFTNVIKNLGIGLYPMQSTKEGGFHWEYSVPHTQVPGMKGGIPHEVWIPELDPKTHMPQKDPQNRYIVKKTGGINATMIDIVKAVANQDIFMIHVVDGIEMINRDHMGNVLGERVAEGLVFAGLDPVAIDLLSARYMFSNVPLEKALKVELNDRAGGQFPQAVPIPVLEGKTITTKLDFDCPLSRDRCLENAEKRGLGKRTYHAIGHDTVTDSQIVSLNGHLGAVRNGTFSDLITETLYFDVYKMPWDMQKTALKYMEAVDQLTGSSLKEKFLSAFDENGDGIVSYDEFGRKGLCGTMMWAAGDRFTRMGTEKLGYLKGRFSTALMAKISDPSMNADGHDIFNEMMDGAAVVAAFQMSQMDLEMDDPFQHGLKWGKGKWPSFQLAKFFQTGVSIYGESFPFSIAFPSLYGTAFFYADITQNNGKYAGAIRTQPDPEALGQYMTKVTSGEEKPLDFTFYVPAGFDDLSGNKPPNVEVTDDPGKILTVSFAGGKEIWPDTLL
jgi:hypothetical protein